MKQCTVCQATYPTAFSHCPQDGSSLVDREVWTAGSIIRGKYRILNQCGAGAMAIVYKALHIGLDEVRALKVINAELAGSEDFVRRFKEEARLARKLQHPNIVRIDDIDDAEDGRPFIVMEFVEGSDLKVAIQNGPLPLSRVLAIGRQVSCALEAAHNRGIIHRDIKPENILLAQSAGMEQVKVADFGIAKAIEQSSADMSPSITRTGHVIGSPAYMSPEQAMGAKTIDGRSDLYSLGVVMYQAITGKFPITADSQTAFLAAHANVPPIPIRELVPNLPDNIANVIMACLEKDPDLRPQNAKALIWAIDNGQPASHPTVLKQTAPPLRTLPPPSRSIGPRILQVLGYFLILWGASTVSSPASWLAAGVVIGLLQIVYPPENSSRTKALLIVWTAAAVVAAALSYFAISHEAGIWSYVQQSIEIRMDTIRWLITASTALVFVMIGSTATPRSARGSARLLGIFTAIAACGFLFGRSRLLIGLAGSLAIYVNFVVSKRQSQSA